MRIGRRRVATARIRRARAFKKRVAVVAVPGAVMRVAGCLLAFLLLTGVFSYLLFKPEAPKPVLYILLYDHRSETVAQVDIEEYLVGVLAGEMPASYELEALKAQAVAARTYTYRKMRQNSCGREGAHVCTDSGHCQAYSDIGARQTRWGENFEGNEAKIRQAIIETRGQIMLYDDKPIDALYHSTSGGRTEDVENVYAAALPYLRGVESPGEEDAPRFSSTVTLKASAFIAALKKENAGVKLSASKLVQGIGEPLRFPSGRVDTINVGGAVFTGRDFRRIFNLDSTIFTIAVEDDRVCFSTRGYGHGVGMSQVGANAMAKAGCRFDQILLHYYTGIVIATI
jgi:stage II sporulation protein D